VGLLLAGCLSTRQVLTTPQPQDLASYLASRRPEDILVRDSKGGDHWIHHPLVDGDTVRGVRGRDLPQPRIAIAVGDVSQVEEPHFSAGRTLGLVGVMLGTAAVVLAILASRIGLNY
jgi:hypothetical protein